MAGRGLIPPHTIVSQEDLRKLSGVPIDHRDARFREPLERDARAFSKTVGPDCEVVLLGSIATPKYVEPLLGIFGEALALSVGVCRARRYEPWWLDAEVRP